jgi:uncharacterized protein (DUF342 family)
MTDIDKPAFKTADDIDLFHDQMLCKLALAYKLIGSDRYQEALDRQKTYREEGRIVLLRDVLLIHGFLTDEDLDFLNHAKDIMTEKRKEKRFGMIAVKQGFISEENLLLALKRQKVSRQEIGQILLEMGYITDEQRTKILELQKRIVVTVPPLRDIIRFSDEKKNSVTAENAMTLNVSRDSLKAVVLVPENLADVQADDILSFAAFRGVSYGLAGRDEVDAFLGCRELGLNGLIVARGQAGIPPVTGKIVFHFTPRPLESGIGDGSTRTYVNRGDLLAEREIVREGRPRVTVYGAKHDEQESGEPVFANGNGARMNDRKDRITAAVDGEPFIHPDGAVCVLEEKVISAVSGLSGPVAFEGNLRVEGAVSGDAVITCSNMEADRVEGARITADGDLWVKEGLSDSEVVASGQVRAGSIRNCRIASVGDVTVESVVEGADIETGGTCVAGGTVSGSRIMAGKGVVASDVRSDRENPTQMGFGKTTEPRAVTDSRRRLEELEKQISELVYRIHTVESMLEIVDLVMQKIHRDMSNMEKEQNTLLNTATRMEEKNGRKVFSLREKIDDLGLRIKGGRETLKDLTDNRFTLRRNLDSLKKALQVKVKDRKESEGELVRIKGVLEGRLGDIVGDTQVTVTGTIGKSSVVEGPHAQLTLGESMTRVTFTEEQVYESEGPGTAHYTIGFGRIS